MEKKGIEPVDVQTGGLLESLSREERLRLVASLNWDYDADPSSMLDVIDGLILKVEPFDARRLLVRSLERLTWHRIVALWGVERLLAVYDPMVLSRIRSTTKRGCIPCRMES